MALADILQQRVRASKADSDDEMEASTSPSDLEVIRGAKNSDQQAIDSSGEDIVIAGTSIIHPATLWAWWTPNSGQGALIA